MYARYFKRVIDFVLSLTALIILFPLLILLTVIGAIVLRGNPFFVQKRPGMIDKKTGQERIISVVKFRTMTNRKNSKGDLLSDEERLVPYGRFLRSTSLDELPYLVNIVSGAASLVGPRPFLVRDLVFMTDEQRRRHTVRPGLTGLAQVNGRNNITWLQKFEYDLQYIDEGITFVGDMKIILVTVRKVLKRSDTVREGTVSDIDYGDWLLQEGKISSELYAEKQEEAKRMMIV